MTARVLVVDDLAPNLRLLEARLSAEYFEVLTATNGADALQICASGDCDIVLLDVMMPGMDGLEVCRRLKGDNATAHIPVVLVTALDQPSDRRRGLEAGADDFLTKPIDEIALFARVHSLARLRLILDELRSRAVRSSKLGIGDPFTSATADNGTGGRIMLVEDSPSSAALIENALRRHHYIEIERDRGKRSTRVPPAITISSSSVSISPSAKGCGFARDSDPRSAPAKSRCWRSPTPRIAGGSCAASILA